MFENCFYFFPQCHDLKQMKRQKEVLYVFFYSKFWLLLIPKSFKEYKFGYIGSEDAPTILFLTGKMYFNFWKTSYEAQKCSVLCFYHKKQTPLIMRIALILSVFQGTPDVSGTGEIHSIMA